MSCLNNFDASFFQKLFRIASIIIDGAKEVESAVQSFIVIIIDDRGDDTFRFGDVFKFILISIFFYGSLHSFYHAIFFGAMGMNSLVPESLDYLSKICLVFQTN